MIFYPLHSLSEVYVFGLAHQLPTPMMHVRLYKYILRDLKLVFMPVRHLRSKVLGSIQGVGFEISLLFSLLSFKRSLKKKAQNKNVTC